VTSTLQSGWDSRPSDQTLPQNNARIPRFVAGDGGTIYYVNDNTSPCTGSTIWIACNPNTPGSKTGYEIHIRVLPSSGAPTWMWYHRDDTCSDVRDDGYATSVCFSVRRAVTHEMEHNTLTRSHDEQGGADSVDTVMAANTPTKNGSPDYWNTATFLRCDHAGALMEYGVLDRTRKYPNCFATTPGEGTKGLNTTLTVAATSYTACANGSNTTVTGRLALQNDWANYKYLANTPLAGRVLNIYRKTPSATSYPTSPTYTVTATDTNSGSNWSKAFSSTTAVTYNYKAVWTTSASEYALNSSNEVYWTIKWQTTLCPLSITDN
jgi:hypothetical protein